MVPVHGHKELTERVFNTQIDEERLNVWKDIFNKTVIFFEVNAEAQVRLCAVER